MYHAASAAILAAGGVGRHRDAPKSHEHVIEHYGNIVQRHPDTLAETGLWLNRTRTERVVADYDLSRDASASDATEITGQAKRMLAAIRATWPPGAKLPHKT
jgi:uncharacterized protein (UPF0332 family)